MTETETKNKIFIEKAVKVHGDLYDYSKVEYILNNLRVTILCKTHGKFEQTPSNHLTGYGCKKCTVDASREKYRRNINKFLEDCKKIHNDIYDYSKMTYINNKIELDVICNKHGEFKVLPLSHLKGIGCKKCFGKRYMDQEKFIESSNNLHHNLYDYTKVKYIDAKTKITIICKKHGEFEQTPNNHLTGFGCIKCAGTDQLNTSDFIIKAKKVHGDLYDYSKTEYISGKQDVSIICKKHGEFKQKASKHINASHGCPKCVISYCSKQQIIWLDFMAIYYNIKIQHHMNKGEHRIKNSNYKADGYCKETNHRRSTCN